MSDYEDDYYFASGAKGYAQIMARRKEREQYFRLMSSLAREMETLDEDYDDVMCPAHYWPDEREDVEDD